MKILFDVVYTNRPSVCSTSYLVWELIERLMEWRDDIFFYVTYPPNKINDDDQEFLARHSDRVRLLPVTSEPTDRVSELFSIPRELKKYFVPWNSECWDYDVVVSSRVPMLGAFWPHFARYSGRKMPGTRAVFGLEEMPVLPFRKTVPWHEHLHLQSIASYLHSTGILINNQWTLTELKKVGRDLLSPAQLKKLMTKVHEVVPVRLTRLNLKKDLTVGAEFNVTFVGRVTSTRNVAQVLDLFRKQFAYPIGKTDMRFLISTNSLSMGGTDYGEMDFIDMQMNNRKEFYEFLGKAHVAVNLTHVEDFSLSTWETLLNGVPVIVLDEAWNSFLGPDYPFRVKSQVEAYAMLNAMVKDYPAMYQKFVDWEASYWAAYVDSDKNVTTSEKLIELIDNYETWRDGHLSGDEQGKSYKLELDEFLKDDPQVIDLTAYLKDKNNGTAFHDGKSEFFSLPLAKVPNNHLIKVLAGLRGYRDTNQVGVMVKEQP
ncbi:n-acetyl-alpha-d-glucosaminyl l-malate synthase [Stenotrophomonas phage vB_SmaS_DLP_5]|uniref:N-acetyl-alpha-d-glucosaminyl l-malate synthase n=1 Tax=Stenotrophomonas phage vB_SmaS_DLP_5 TaxID=2044561 RepID=A0A2D2W2B0_9CAUD|nr:n-acetyl-alpha-d-glucosaminyl l-malate synthase [Stenotrophomonas phage vB_SmaS_DLP_5]ATS92278.1 n-acetyl-alpha-d-glucosaminyl l-malate synthase [Stenotrophomonas phage vB_SmaS_DLP_5]